MAKLCKACGKKMQLNRQRYIFCDNTDCFKTRRKKINKKYRIANPQKHRHFHSDNLFENWICKCPEQWLIPLKFNKCIDCGDTNKNGKKQNFIPYKHTLDVNILVNNYFKKNEIWSKHKI